MNLTYHDFCIPDDPLRNGVPLNPLSSTSIESHDSGHPPSHLYNVVCSPDDTDLMTPYYCSLIDNAFPYRQVDAAAVELYLVG